MWAPDSYAASFAHAVRVDKYDNVWFVDEGSNMVVKMDPNGVVKLTLGRKPEAIDYFERFLERGEKDSERYTVGTMGTFNRPTDVTWDTQDNIYISDGYGNSRFVKIARDGTWVKAIKGACSVWNVERITFKDAPATHSRVGMTSEARCGPMHSARSAPCRSAD